MERTDILELMTTLKLYGMRAAYDEVIATGIKRRHEPPRIVGDLLNAEIAEKQARSIKYQLTIAKLPLSKDLNEFDFSGTPINEALVRDLAGGGFLAEPRNAVLVGGTGTGKSHLAIAIARLLHPRRCPRPLLHRRRPRQPAGERSPRRPPGQRELALQAPRLSCRPLRLAPVGKPEPPTRRSARLVAVASPARGSLLFATGTSLSRRPEGPYWTPIRGPVSTPSDKSAGIRKSAGIFPTLEKHGGEPLTPNQISAVC